MERVPGCEVIFTDPSIFLQRTSKTMYRVVHINGFTAGGYAALGSLGQTHRRRDRLHLAIAAEKSFSQYPV